MFNKFLYDAKAHVKGSNKFPRIDGFVYFNQTRNGVIVTAEIHNLPTSRSKCSDRFFGFHIHEGTSCTGNADDIFANVKMHYNPDRCDHPFHSGDLPPLLENNGFAYMCVLVDKFRVRDIIGRTVVIHDMPDDFKTQPSGNSGVKIACGKIV